MLIVWWSLWLCPVLATPPDLATCSRKWVRMTDRNYQRAIKHYADCVLLGQALDPPAREMYQSNIVVNLQKTCNYFFQRTSLPTSGLIGVVREVAKILEGFEQETTTISGLMNNNLSWSTVKAQCKSIPPLDIHRCPNPTRSPNKCNSNAQTASSKNSCSQTAMYFMLLVFILLLILQIIFITWFCCCNNCICLEVCKNEGSCLCDEEDDSCADYFPATEVYHMTEVQQDLASLSSENIGSDSEFEALLKMTRLPKTNREWHNKEAD